MRRWLTLLALTLAAAASPARAQDVPDLPGAEPVRIASAEFVPDAAAAGGTATLEIRFEIAEPYHLYAQQHAEEGAPTFRWELPSSLQLGAVEEVSEPDEFRYPNLDLVYRVHHGELVLRQRFHVGASAPLGRVEVRGTVDYQYCDAGMCYPADPLPVSAALTIVPADEAPAAVPAPPRAEDAAPVESQKPAELSLGLVLQALLFGLITVLTPCVFPLLPVTVSFFAKQKGNPLPRSLVYAGGIVFTISAIGLVFRSSLEVFAAGNLFNVFVALLFLVLALSLFGLFDLRLPSFLIDWSSGKSSSGGLVGPFFMAVTLALTSFSCSMPFLALMFQGFEQGAYLPSVVGIGVFASAIALPFFVCSLFPTALQSLPRAGSWMNAVKVTMGFVELGLAFKFLRTVALNLESDALSRGLVLAIWTACALGAALYLFGYVTLPHDTRPQSIGVFRLLFALLFLTLAIYLVPGTFGQRLSPMLEGFLQTRPDELALGRGRQAEHIAWVKNDWDGSLARAAEKRRPVLFDFTGTG